MTSDGRETSLSIDLGGEQVLLERVESTEALGQPFLITVDLIAPLGELDLLPHMGKPALVTVNQDGELQRYFHGLAVEGEYLKESPEGFHHRLRLRPWTYFLAQNRDFAIYQDMNALDIVKRVLAEAGATDVDYTRISRTPPVRTYTVQYGESDFAFVSRLMECEGIYYHFRHEADRHVMVLCDSPGSHGDGAPPRLTYNPLTLTVFNTDSAARTDKNRRHYVQSWTERVATAGVARVTTRDFDFEHPQKPLQAVSEGAGAHPGDAVEVYAYPGGYKREADGAKLSAVALDARRADRKTYAGQSQATGLACGAKVAIADHPLGRLNGSYLVSRTFHSITAERYRTGANRDEDPFNVRIEAVPAATPWRAPQATPRPVVHGPETAIVTGPAGEEIFTDEYGRVKVRFHWDRSDSPGEKTSCWIRVSQTGGLGNVILPRVGHEVLVDFLGGDPDRPVVVGRVFNRSHMPVYPLPANKTVALWRTKRYGATGDYGPAKPLDTGAPGANEIRFEDKGGSEEMYVHAERDMKTRVRLAETHHVGANQQLRVGNDRNKQVENNETVDVGVNRTSTIGTDDTLTIGGKLTVVAGTSITLRVGATTVVIDGSGIAMNGTHISATGGATAEVASPLTTVQGKGTLTLTGGLTKIN